MSDDQMAVFPNYKFIPSFFEGTTDTFILNSVTLKLTADSYTGTKQSHTFTRPNIAI
jgi:hypothetical protein